jgi:Uma2 family endonuclease
VSIASGPQQAPAVPPVPVLRLSVEQYHEMGRAGILSPEDRVELLEGWLVPKMMKNPRHRIATEAMRGIFERLLPQGWHVNSQEPITLSTSEPEPDVAVIRGSLRDYRDRHPGPRDVAIVIEVADTTLHDDEMLKKTIYARDGVAVYWIVNLVENCLEMYSDPTGPCPKPDYRQHRTMRPGQQVAVVLDGREMGAFLLDDALP